MKKVKTNAIVIYTDEEIAVKIDESNLLNVKIKSLEAEVSKLAKQKYRLADEIASNNAKKASLQVIGKFYKDEPEFLKENSIEPLRQTYYKVLPFKIGSKKQLNIGAYVPYEYCRENRSGDDSILVIQTGKVTAAALVKNCVEITEKEYMDFKAALVAKALS